jgi:hypothetical protein
LPAESAIFTDPSGATSSTDPPGVKLYTEAQRHVHV